MRVVTLKMEDALLKAIDALLGQNYYSTRTEFIRDALRSKLEEIDLKQRLASLAKLRGSVKPGDVRLLSKDELDELALASFKEKRDVFKELGL